MVLAAPGPEAVREPEEILLVDRVQHCDHCTLDDFVFQRSDPQRALLAARLRYVAPPDRQCPVRSALDPCVQVLEILFQFRLVVRPPQTVYPGCGRALKRVERFP
jgi:hypothetical protein